MIRTYSDLTQDDKGLIRRQLDVLIQSLSESLNASPEGIATELFYRLQRHPDYARNANTTQKNKSYTHYDGICQNCHKPVSRREAKFHHLKRGLRNQHAPENLVPYHVDCHDHEHGAVNDSLSKGSPKRKPNKTF